MADKVTTSIHFAVIYIYIIQLVDCRPIAETLTAIQISSFPSLSFRAGQSSRVFFLRGSVLNARDLERAQRGRSRQAVEMRYLVLYLVSVNSVILIVQKNISSACQEGSESI